MMSNRQQALFRLQFRYVLCNQQRLVSLAVYTPVTMCYLVTVISVGQCSSLEVHSVTN